MKVKAEWQSGDLGSGGATFELGDEHKEKSVKELKLIIEDLLADTAMDYELTHGIKLDFTITSIQVVQ